MEILTNESTEDEQENVAVLNTRPSLGDAAAQALLDIGQHTNFDVESRIEALTSTLLYQQNVKALEAQIAEKNTDRLFRELIEQPVAGMELEMPKPFYELSVPKLSYFMVRCVLAAVPAVVLAFAVYIAGLVISSALLQLTVG